MKPFSNRHISELNESITQKHYSRILKDLEPSKKYKTNKRLAKMRVKYHHLETLNKKNTDDI